ncbi:MAG: NADH-quinone oxidoreductase subunit J, partial [Paracoccaceae bacterium]|nr:NADH-quinone oxidoreductase subunit J [Paracoccaceae bacterium]
VAMLLIIVYVGAVAVLFLFVVMMLDVDFAELKAEMAKYMPLGLLIGLILVIQLVLAFGPWSFSPAAQGLRAAVTPAAAQVQNTKALGLILYDKYVFLFMVAALVLLVAMIGAIVLTMRHRKDVKRQNVLAQMWRDPAKAMELRDVKPGQGL